MFIFIRILFIFLGAIFSSKVIKVIFIIIGVIFVLISMCFSFGYFHTLIITIGSNDLTILQKAFLRRKLRVYKKGKIVNLPLIIRPYNEGVMMNNYYIIISTKDGDEEIDSNTRFYIGYMSLYNSEFLNFEIHNVTEKLIYIFFPIKNQLCKTKSFQIYLILIKNNHQLSKHIIHLI